MHALIQSGTIVQILGRLPDVWHDGTRWWNIAGGAIDPADIGWLPVTLEPRPDDTETTTWDRAEPALIDGVPVIGWTERDKTPEELAADQANANAATLTADAGTDLPKIEQAIADTLALLGPSDQEGSIRHHRTTVLTNSYTVSAQRAQDDLILALAVVVRRHARQEARLTRLVAGLLDSAAVGEDAT